MSDNAPMTPDQSIAELIEQGNNPAKYQWMQCRIGDTSLMGVITGYDEVGEFEHCTSVTFRDEADTWYDPSLVVPLLGLPRLEWPGGGVEGALIAEKRAHQELRKCIEERIRELKQPLCSHMPEGDELDDYLEQWGRQSYEAEILTRILGGDDG